jgi:hypothetical protein
MGRWPVISALAIVLSLGLSACSSSSDGLLAQANLLGQSGDMCDSGRGAPAGNAALIGPQAAYAQCVHDQLAPGQAAYDEEEGQFPPGSHPSSLSDLGD